MPQLPAFLASWLSQRGPRSGRNRRLVSRACWWGGGWQFWALPGSFSAQVGEIMIRGGLGSCPPCHLAQRAFLEGDGSVALPSQSEYFTRGPDGPFPSSTLPYHLLRWQPSLASPDMGLFCFAFWEWGAPRCLCFQNNPPEAHPIQPRPLSSAVRLSFLPQACSSKRGSPWLTAFFTLLCTPRHRWCLHSRSAWRATHCPRGGLVAAALLGMLQARVVQDLSHKEPRKRRLTCHERNDAEERDSVSSGYRNGALAQISFSISGPSFYP